MKRRWFTASKLLAFWMLALTSLVSVATLGLMRSCIKLNYTGALYPLSALITMCQAGNAFVLAKITDKSKAENTRGGIIYDAALNNPKRDA